MTLLVGVNMGQGWITCLCVGAKFTTATDVNNECTTDPASTVTRYEIRIATISPSICLRLGYSYVTLIEQ